MNNNSPNGFSKGLNSATDSQLVGLWSRVRLQLLLLAEGATTNYDPQTGRIKPESKEPPNRGEDLAQLERRWKKALSRRAKRAVLWDAITFVFLDSTPEEKRLALPYMPNDRRDQLRKLTIRQMRGTEEWKRAVAREEGSLRLVAKRYGIAHDTVSRYRKLYGSPAKSNGHGRSRLALDRSTDLFVYRTLEGMDA